MATMRTSKRDRKSTRLNSSHLGISYAVFCLKKTELIPVLTVGAATGPGLRVVPTYVAQVRASGDRYGAHPGSPELPIPPPPALFFFKARAPPQAIPPPPTPLVPD